MDHRSDRQILLDIERRLKLLEGITIMADQDFASELSRLQGDVAAETDQVKAAETLLSGLSAQIKANANDPAAISALADTIEAQTSELAASISANTPAAPATAAPVNPDTATSGGVSGDQSSATPADTGQAPINPGEAGAIPASGPGSETTGQVDNPTPA